MTRALNTSSELTFGIEFVAEVKLRYLVLQDDAFTPMPRSMQIAPSKSRPGSISLRMAVDSTSTGDAAVELQATPHCDATGAICTFDGRKLSHSTSVVRPS
ncbi:MAG: hypothetical protein OXE87_06455 [Chloroflexi bacterium]|nr:hypothetical protein [Chloroflexota bacterium]